MKLLLMYLLEGLVCSIGDNINSAFSNNISVDSVCVLGCFSVVRTLSAQFSGIGKNAYTASVENEKLCMLISVFCSCIVGALLFVLSGKIPLLYDLSAGQRVLFSRCLFIWSFGIIADRVQNLLYVYLLYTAQIKLMRWTSVAYYCIQFVADYTIVRFDCGLNMLIFAEVLLDVVYAAFLFAFSGFLKTKSNYSWMTVKILFRRGIDIALSNAFSKVPAFVLGIFASRLTVEAYAVHSVCLGVVSFLHEWLTYVCDYVVFKLSKMKTDVRKYKVLCKIRKTYFPIISVFTLLLIVPALAFLHGKVAISACIPWVFLYCSQGISLLLYEFSRGFLLSTHYTKILKYCGVVGVFVGVSAVLFVHYLHLGLLGFSLIGTVNYAGQYFLCNIISRNFRRVVYRYPILKNNIL